MYGFVEKLLFVLTSTLSLISETTKIHMSSPTESLTKETASLRFISAIRSIKKLHVIYQVFMFIFLVTVMSCCASLFSFPLNPLTEVWQQFYSFIFAFPGVVGGAILLFAQYYRPPRLIGDVKQFYLTVMIIYLLTLFAVGGYLIYDVVWNCKHNLSLHCTNGISNAIYWQYWWNFYSVWAQIAVVIALLVVASNLWEAKRVIMRTPGARAQLPKEYRQYILTDDVFTVANNVPMEPIGLREKLQTKHNMAHLFNKGFVKSF
jgi:hypothetical protein